MAVRIVFVTLSALMLFSIGMSVHTTRNWQQISSHTSHQPM